MRATTAHFSTFRIMKIYSSDQIKEIDKQTIEQQNISSDKLMERAAYAFVDALPLNELKTQRVTIIAGIGNNGGDALAIARILLDKGIHNKVVFCQISPNISNDCKLNLKRLEQYGEADILHLTLNQALPNCTGIVIDGMFGSGLNRPIEGYWATLIQKINREANRIISIDIPSGFFADKLTNSEHIQNAEVYTFDSPKLSFLLPESQEAISSFQVLDIGLDEKTKANMTSTNHYIDRNFISTLIRKRKKFSHKGTYGKVCIVGGTETMIGGVILAGRAAMAAGCGYVYYQIPANKWEIALSQHPEAIVLKTIWLMTMDRLNKIQGSDKYTFGIGPAMGQSKQSEKTLLAFLKDFNEPVVLDADALNIIARNGIEKSHIPQSSILTPHHKEFERLLGDSADSFDQLAKAKEIAIVKNIYLCLKGPHTIIVCPNGECYFNSTGNPGMAVAGSGDVLTGIITSLLAQNKLSKEAAILGVYIHGYAGNLGANTKGEYGLTANDIVSYIPQAIKDQVC